MLKLLFTILNKCVIAYRMLFNLLHTLYYIDILVREQLNENVNVE